jgi:hypothetical protein
MNLRFYLLFFILIGFIGCSKDFSETDDFGLYDSKDGSSGSSTGSGSGNQPGVITAGEWNDLNNWDFWLGILERDELDSIPLYWNYNTKNRIAVEVKNSSGYPAIDVLVKLQKNGQIVFTSRTDNQGKAELWPGLFEGNSQVNISEYALDINNGEIKITGLKLFGQGTNYATIQATIPATNIDVAFVVDATGSMGDELEYLKVELVDVLSRVKSSNPGSTIRTGSVFYRDKGDDYVTRLSKFTNDHSTTVNFIKDQEAGGGGDWPEAVHSALGKAVKELAWSASAKTRLIFLVLDAPPHYEPDVTEEIQEYNRLAAENGIKIIPVTASGIDKGTELLMRFLAVSTNGTYVFITNHSGIGDEHLEPTVGEYEVEFLNDLMVRLINKYAE